MNRIITLEDLVERDQLPGVKEWILWMCQEAKRTKKISHGWDGLSVEGEPVLAFVNNGRWLARCKVCGNPMYVSHQTPIAYCVECGNGGSRSAYPVAFPPEREEIEAVLLSREVAVAERVYVRNDVERAMSSRPVVPGLGRNWRPGITTEQLREENEQAVRGKRR